MICLSCNTNTSTDNINDLPLELCANCARLLNAMALRPDMWQRLARIIGPNHYLLHDDFYDDNGLPYAPEIKINKADYDNYIVKRGGPYNGVQAYLDDMLTWFIIFGKDLTTPRELDLKQLQVALFNEIRNSSVNELIYKSYQIILSLPKDAAIYSFLVERWKKDLNQHWGAIARCVIKNYPISESRSLLMESLIEETWQYPKDMLHVLSDYGEELAIDMLAEIISKRQIPIMYDLGAIARASNPSWHKLKSMIVGGRPMSLIAIDALWIEDSNQYRRYFDRRKLIEIAVDQLDLKSTLENYIKKDAAPRVQSAVASVFAKYNIQ